MKYFVFYASCCIGIPIAVILCSLKRTFSYIFLAIMLISLLWPSELSITFAERQHYRISTRGFEIHLADLMILTLAIYLAVGRRGFRVHWLPPLSIPLLLFMGFGVISWLSVVGKTLPIPEAVKLSRKSMMLLDYGTFELGLYPLFELSKLLRGFLVFWVCANLFQDPQARKTLYQVLAMIVVFLAVNALISRYVFGDHRVSSAIGHTNDFNCFIGILGVFVFPAVFQREKLYQSSGYAIAAMMGFVAIVLTVSRSSLAGYGLALLIGMSFGLIRFTTLRNILLTFTGLAVACLAMLKAADTLISRFFVTETYDESMGERLKYIMEAKMMAQDFFFGTGLGNFSAWSWSRYSTLAEAPPGTLVHNIWFLTVAEVGYIGLGIFALIWARFYQMIISMMVRRLYWRESTLFIGMIGVLTASLVLHLQNLYHFSFRQLSIFFITNVIFGFLSAIYQERRRRYVAKEPIPTVSATPQLEGVI